MSAEPVPATAAPAPHPAPAAARTQRSRRRRSGPLVALAALMIGGVTVVPIGYVVLGGFRTTAQINADPVGLPRPWVLDNYSAVLGSGTFWRMVLNSLTIAVLAGVLVVAAGALAAFALSRYEFRGRDLVYGFFTFGLLFPIGVAVLPLYLLLRELYLLESPLGVAVPEAAFGIPVTIVILRPFMRSIPGELEDAAALDGCSGFSFFLRILLPLSRPALTTVGVLAFVGSWNAYLLPLLVLSSEASYTLPLGTAAFSSQYTQDTAKIFAFTSLSMVPALVFFLVAQRWIVNGLSGAVKG